MFAIKVGGVWMQELGANPADVTWTEQRNTPAVSGASGGGMFWDLSWTMPSLAPDYLIRQFRGRQRVELWESGVRVGQGILANIDRSSSPVRFTATGLCQEAARYPAITTDSGKLIQTSSLDDAMVYAITQGLPWTAPAISDDPLFPDDSANDVDATAVGVLPTRTLQDLLDAYCKAKGKVWWVDANAVLHVDADATTPRWYGTPAIEPPSVTDDYYSHVYLIFRDNDDIPSGAAYGKVHVAVASDAQVADQLGYAALVMDATPLGNIGSTSTGPIPGSLSALDLARNQLAADKPRWQVTDKIVLTAYSITSAGGQPVSMSMVRAGDVIRIYGVTGADGIAVAGTYRDVLANTVEYAPDLTSVAITPRGFAPRDLEAVIAQVLADSPGPRANLVWG